VFNNPQGLSSGKGNAEDGRAQQAAGDQGNKENGGSVASPDTKAATEVGGEGRGAADDAGTPDGGGGGKCVERFKSSTGSVGPEVECTFGRGCIYGCETLAILLKPPRASIFSHTKD